MNDGFLNALRVGESGVVAGVEGECAMRRRLFDLGLVPGTAVTCTAVSPAGDPAAYLIRGAVIAIRGRDAAGVRLGGGPWN
ncbi:FeoA family protein [Flavonifractor sp. HCP28S3_F3]|uniref:FeoA family protein n=1 Tax=Flavonifractor sp. HCP28S3_F3 TaxID=3438939 RepID=UPI003F8C71C8